AQSIAGRPGMLAGFVAGMIASATGSGFIGGIIGGFAGGYFTQFVVNMLKGLPRQLEGLKSIFIVPIVTVLVIGVGMVLLGGPCSMLNESMMSFLEKMQESSPIVLGLIIGCMSAFDMGGPVNKAAYVTGTMLLAQGNYLFMAGVSAACITPPLVIALAATFKKDRFTEEDRTAGLINYVLGCTHITEGAIPFAAKNPLKVIPVLMAGSSISAIATYMMKVEVPAPHGGFLILGLVNKPLVWVACILLGSAVGAVLYVLVTPKVEVAGTGEKVSLDTTSKNEAKEEKLNLYAENTVCMDLKAKTKKEAIDEMVELLNKNGVLSDKNKFKQEILKREESSSTGFGNGVAIPHAKTSAVKVPRVAVGISKEGFDFDSLDGQKVNLIFMIAAGEGDNDLHLKTLSALAQDLMDEEFVNAILNSKNEKEIVKLLNK
ncbi:MAG: fructose-specific PTS transporter subunit EIIC, partial [Intestinibacter sp.]|uniref:fructose-specific PTS transporter subunit EIIC n=1 Tax=Intestinibacter sp. TaxID=1965304 RepID=UPI003F18577A